MPVDAKSDRQTAWTSLDVALAALTETTTVVLGAVVSLERRVVNRLTSPKVTERDYSPSPLGTKQNPPLLEGIEERVRTAVGQLREAQDILHGIERELAG